MVEKTKKRLDRDDWLRAALTLCESGIESVKVAPLARDLGVTTGSFYWHFKNRQELLEALLEFWERELTNKAIAVARQHAGPPRDRILFLMETVMVEGLARYDLPIWHWAQVDTQAGIVFRRGLRKRLKFARWMFEESGFSAEQAKTRGRMMVILLMGESTLIPGFMTERKEFLKQKHAILTSPEVSDRTRRMN